jgi:polysaccharide pyruvyl transferase WcaK-like protein
LAHYRSFRDEASREFIGGLGIDTRSDPVYPDLVFKLPLGPAADRKARQPIAIGVGVMEYCGWEYVTVEQRTHSLIYHEYISKITLYIRSLLDQGYVVRLLIGELADLRAVEDIVGKLKERRFRPAALAPPTVEAGQLIAEPIRSLDDVITQIARTDIVVASRYHNVVCALRMARPTISIGYETKNDAVMTKLGLGGFCQRISDLDVTKLQSQTQELLRHISFYEQQTRQYLEQFLCQMAEREELVRLALL